MIKTHSPSQAVNQLKDQLSSEKRKLSFFFGAGTSMAVGIPGVIALTNKIADTIDTKFKKNFLDFKASCNSDNIEVILNKLRVIRELIGDSSTKEFDSIKGMQFCSRL